MAYTEITIHAVGGVAAQLLPADNTRLGFRVENSLSAPIFITMTNPAVSGVPSWRIAPSNTSGDWAAFETPPMGPPGDVWYYKTSATGDFTVRTW